MKFEVEEQLGFDTPPTLSYLLQWVRERKDELSPQLILKPFNQQFQAPPYHVLYRSCYKTAGKAEGKFTSFPFYCGKRVGPGIDLLDPVSPEGSANEQ